MKITVIALATQWSMPFSMNTGSYMNYVSTRFLETGTRWRFGEWVERSRLNYPHVLELLVGGKRKQEKNAVMAGHTRV